MSVTPHPRGRRAVDELGAAFTELDDADVILVSDIHAIDE
jgi:hypothetical protein